MTQGRALTAAQRATFLQRLAESANVTASAMAAGCHRNTAYDHKAADTEFAAAWDEAMEMATDALEAEGRRRAMQGVEELYVSQGRVVTDREGNPLVKRVYSDTLMLALLKAHRPERFRERSAVQITGKDDGPIEVQTARERIASRIAGLAGAGTTGSDPI